MSEVCCYGGVFGGGKVYSWELVVVLDDEEMKKLFMDVVKVDCVCVYYEIWMVVSCDGMVIYFVIICSMFDVYCWVGYMLWWVDVFWLVDE